MKEKEKETQRQFELNQALIRSQALMDILETKRHFVQSVTHEVRSPLNVVLSGLNYLTNQREFDPNIMETISSIRLSCSTAIDILSDLLTYEKIESGVQQLELTEVDLHAEIRSTLHQLVVQARENGVALTYNYNCAQDELICTGPLVSADSKKLAQVVRNLVSNAIKFSGKDGIVAAMLTVCPAQDERGPFVRFEVNDNGPGICKENQQRLFREIVQFKPNELQQGGGSGVGKAEIKGNYTSHGILGLWVSRGIIEMHSGKIGMPFQ